MGIISSCCSHDASVEAEENKSTMKKEPSPTKADATEMAVAPAASREKERMMEKSAKVTASGSEYEITLDRSTGKRLGIDVDHKDGKTLLIECINEGLVKDWNDTAPDETKVQINDRITEAGLKLLCLECIFLSIRTLRAMVDEPRHGEAWALVVAADPVGAELSAAVLHAGLRAEVVAPATALSCIGRLPGRLAVVLAQSPEKDFLRCLRRGHGQVFTIAMDEAFAHCPASRLDAFDAGARMVTSSVAAVKEALTKVSAVFSSAGPFACTACGLSPLSENALHLHMHFHHAVDAVSEDSCPICAERPSNLAVHLHNSHGPPAEREPPRAPYATFAWCVCRRLDGRFLLVNEPSGIAGGRPNFWLPAGRVDRGESLQEACRREALEEAGISVRVTGLLRLMVDSHHTLRAVFLAEPEDDAHAEPKSVPDWESVGAMWAEVADIQKLKESDFRHPDPQELYPKVASGSLKPQPVDTKEFVALEALIRRLTAGDRKALRELDGVWRSVQAAYPTAVFTRA
ncbi:ndx-1 [Symbiodinium necroappetens]|uniref:Ndx-1 protein n=1 Tax=Symbiodinium necroappetens TaxID=1628268 RepID=A0A812QPR8_9DINO|nr:ndx-1 [Symbiodinium necroappetens]